MSKKMASVRDMATATALILCIIGFIWLATAWALPDYAAPAAAYGLAYGGIAAMAVIWALGG